MSQEQRTQYMPRRNRLLLKRLKDITISVLLAAAMAMLTSLTPARPHRGPLQSPPPPITTSPALFPAFNPTVTDYVVRGVPGQPVQVTVNAPADSWVSVDNQPFQAGTFTALVNVAAGQSFPVAIKHYGTRGQSHYYVRCLPPDFPQYTVDHPGQTQSEWYVVVPATFGYGRTNYIVVFDTNGVPVWWYNDPAVPWLGTFLTDGNLAWTDGGNEAVVRGFDGTLLQKITPANSIGGYYDTHEIVLLPNGNYVFIADVIRTGVNLSAEGGSSSGSVIDCVVEEVTPSGGLVWSWSTLDHISPAQTDPQWWGSYIAHSSPADPFHMNAVEPDGTGTGYVVSCRHLDAVFYIDKATGNILWKLGGTQTPQSLKFINDPYGNFGGQHDSRVRRTSCAIPDGPGLPSRAHQLAVTVHDDGTNQNRLPRAVRYQIDEIAHTATLIESISDPDVPYSGCCGSARRLDTGNWIMSWGDTSTIAEYNPQQQRVFRIQLPNGWLSYRAVPVMPGLMSREDLRDGMDAQFPR